MNNPPYPCPQCDRVFQWGTDEDSPLVSQESCRENAYWKVRAHMDLEHADKLFVCPRQSSAGPEAFWSRDQTCSCCGSLSEDFLLGRLDTATIVLGPTDKSYKVYVENSGGDPISVRGAAKFYFQHLSQEGREHFVALHNQGVSGERASMWQHPPYVMPFFMCNAA